MNIIVPMHKAQRVLHVLRDVELAWRQTAIHEDGNAGVEEIGIRLGFLRRAIETAFEDWDR